MLVEVSMHRVKPFALRIYTRNRWGIYGDTFALFLNNDNIVKLLPDGLMTVRIGRVNQDAVYFVRNDMTSSRGICIQWLRLNA